MVFRNKAEYILKYKPDIIVVPECENAEKLVFNDVKYAPKDMIWFGKNPSKGLGVFSYSHYKLKLLDCHNPAFKNILPIHVSNGNMEFILFAIWANNPEDKDGQYVTQIWKAIHFYEDILSKNNVVLIGDFNSNTIWDKPRRVGNHTTLVHILESQAIYSTYHTFYKQSQGKEKHSTLYMYRHKNKPYHIDFCFASNNFIEKLKNVKIGAFKKWTKYSDHLPLIIEFDI